MSSVEGLLLDIDGVLITSWDPIAGAMEAIAAFRAADVPVCLITNTTTHPRAELAATLTGVGFDVEPGKIVTAVTATAEYLRRGGPSAAAGVFSGGGGRGGPRRAPP